MTDPGSIKIGNQRVNFTVDTFRTADEVRYVPMHAAGDTGHADCENGVVVTTNAKTVFVRYHRNNMLQRTAEGTDPADLAMVRTCDGSPFGCRFEVAE